MAHDLRRLLQRYFSVGGGGLQIGRYLMAETIRTDPSPQLWECAPAECHYAVVQVIFVVRDRALADPIDGVPASQGM